MTNILGGDDEWLAHDGTIKPWHVGSYCYWVGLDSPMVTLHAKPEGQIHGCTRLVRSGRILVVDADLVKVSVYADLDEEPLPQNNDVDEEEGLGL